MTNNPFDFQSLSPGLGPITGVVVDINDPLKRGRVKIRTSQQHSVPVDKLPWVSVTGGTDNPMFRGIGKMHRLLAGSKVVMNWVGEQGMMVVGSFGNSRDVQEAFADLDKNIVTKTRQLAVRNWYEQEFGELDQHPKGVKPNDARQVNNDQRQTSKQDGDPVQEAGSPIGAREPRRMAGGGDGFKGFGVGRNAHTPKTISSLSKTAGDMLQVHKYIESTVGKKGTIIPKSLEMAESLLQKAKTGAISSSTDLVGGASNLAQAAAGALGIVNNNSGGNNEQALSIEEYLRRLYKEITGQDALDAQGNETPQYREWRAEMIQTLRIS